MAGPDAAGFARCETDGRGEPVFSGGDAGTHRRRGDEAMGCSALDGEALENWRRRSLRDMIAQQTNGSGLCVYFALPYFAQQTLTKRIT